MRKWAQAMCLPAGLAVAACGDDGGVLPPIGGTVGTGTDTGDPEPPPPVGPPQGFVDVTEEAGLSYLQHVRVTDPNDCMFAGVAAFGEFACDPQHMSGGVAVADADGDGWPDVFVTRLFARDLLFRNRGDGTFEEVGTAAGLSLVANTNGAAFFDMEGDGDLDLYVTAIGEGRNFLWENQGDGTFVEVAAEHLAALAGPPLDVGTSVLATDVDRDGDVDLYVGDWRPDRPGPDGARAALLRNRGPEAPGYFENATLDAGIVVSDDDGGVWVFSAAATDFGGDGQIDLYAVSDFRTSRFFEGRPGGTFEDVTFAWGAGRERNGMGVAVGDVDLDGDFDLYVTSIGNPPVPCTGCIRGSGNFLYRNDGAGFADVTDLYGVREGYWGWGAVFADFDQDTDLDLVALSGMFAPSALATGGGAYAESPIRYFVSSGPAAKMEDLAAERGLDASGSWKAAATLDFDRDGDLDLFLTRNAGEGVLYRNDTDDGTTSIVVDVRTPAGTPALGAVVEIEDGADFRRITYVGAHDGFLAQSEPVAHFGLPASNDPVDRIRVTYPTGAVVERTQVPRGIRLRIDPP